MFIEEEKVQEKGINIMEYFICRLHNIETKYSVLCKFLHESENSIYFRAYLPIQFNSIFNKNFNIKKLNI